MCVCIGGIPLIVIYMYPSIQLFTFLWSNVTQRTNWHTQFPQVDIYFFFYLFSSNTAVFLYFHLYLYTPPYFHLFIIYFLKNLFSFVNPRLFLFVYHLVVVSYFLIFLVLLIPTVFFIPAGETCTARLFFSAL